MSKARFEEFLSDGYYYGVEATLLHCVQSDYQLIEVLQHPHFGHLLRIDGALQCSEADEACYHEPLVHMVMAHSRDRARVLIVGGGDGGAAEEVLKWPCVQSLQHVELDPEVLHLSRQYLRNIHHGLLDEHQTLDARYTLSISDGLAHIERLQRDGATLDALILDLTDPGGPSLPLWSSDFFARCAQVLGPNGVMGLHVGAPWAQSARCDHILAALRRNFAQVTPFITSIPVSGGPWMMAMASGLQAPSMLDESQLQRKLQTLQGEPLSIVDGRILRAMVGLAHRR